MTVAEFLEWCPDDGQRWELIDGAPREMAPAKLVHNALLGEVAAILRNHLLSRGGPCIVVPASGVIPRVQAGFNFRVPDLAVTCKPFAATDVHLEEPVLLVEVLSPSNQADTWSNVWAYTTIPSVMEILVLRTIAVRADLLRRGADGNWPESPEIVTDGELHLASIGFRAPLGSLYRTTGLVAPRPL
jgi:Uma2 family endonuclease